MLLEVVRDRIRARHYSRRTEKAYTYWIGRFVRFTGRRHPREVGAPEVEAFLTDLAVNGKVSAPTQTQALSALLFLYREVLGIDLPWLDGLVRAKPSKHVPTVLTPSGDQQAACPHGGHLRPDGTPAVRLRHASHGVRALADQGSRFRAAPRSWFARARAPRIG
ncbi:MAG: phage integrase N-terminal SAM-like domain-containing protein [Comamonadaceae bacterium]|nr:phage integrase N-terminal SAM-like domain-containing protein [Comamonadaceae bacterium]